MRQTKTNGVQAVNRALKILVAFKEGDEPLTLAELAQRTGFYKSTLLRIAFSLEEFGFLRRKGDGRFMPGPTLLRLGELYRGSFNLEDFVRPILQNLMNSTGESASLYVRQGNSRICLYRVDSRHSIRDHIHEGDELPLDRGAAGHVLRIFAGQIAGNDESAQKNLMISSFGERDSESAALAAPVFEVQQKLVGAISLSGPLTRFNPAKVKEMKGTLLTAARDLTVTLGGDPTLFDVVRS